MRPLRYEREGDHQDLVVLVENLGGYSLSGIDLELLSGSPYEGGDILETYHLESLTNSTCVSEQLPDVGDGPLYLVLDPDNRIPETNEGNNMVVLGE
jgi:hypothetical protein